MREFREILVPIDFSELSLQTIEPAYSLAKLVGGVVYLMHVIDLPAAANPMYAHYTAGADLSEATRQKLEAELADRLTALIPTDPDYAGVRTEVLVLAHVTPEKAIVEQAKVIGADVILVAHKGWSSLANLFIGSTAEQIIKHAPCPVLVIRT
jgi:nucleotide-binding universal stress UspA family protein